MNAESALVGALLVAPERMGEAAAEIEVSDFTNIHLAKIYGVMLDLWNRGVRPDTHAVNGEMTKRGEWERMNSDDSMLNRLMCDIPNLNLASHIKLMQDETIRRKLLLTTKTAVTVAADRELTAEDAVDAVKELLSSIDVRSSVANEVVPAPPFIEGEDSFNWLIPNLIERGDRILVVAGEGGGKSMLLRQIAVAGAFGIHPFKWHDVAPMRVLLVDLENPVSLIRRKLRPMYHKAREMQPFADPNMLGVLCKPGGIDVTKRVDARWLTTQLTNAQPDLVVLGPLYKLFTSDDKWEQGARTVTTILDDLRTRLGFALVLETHAPQGMAGHRQLRPIGSSLWMRWPDFGISFCPTEQKPEVVKVTTWKGRDERSWPRFLGRGAGFPWVPCDDPAAEARSSGNKPLVPPAPASPRREFNQEEAF